MTCRRSVLALLAGAIISTASRAASVPSAPKGSPEPVIVLPFEVVSTANAPLLPDQAKRLGRIAAERAARTLRQRGLGAEICTLPAGDVPTPGASSVVKGRVRLPAPVPPGQGGARAAFRRSVFAEATVRVERPGGAAVEARANLQWREVRWVRGARMARLRPTDEVLEDAIQKVVDRAARRLASSGVR